MPTYLMLTTLTEKGVQTLHANPARLAEVNRDVEEMGARCSTSGRRSGPTTSANVVEAPDDLTIAKVSIALGRAAARSFSRSRCSRSTSCLRRSRRRQPLTRCLSAGDQVGAVTFEGVSPRR